MTATESPANDVEVDTVDDGERSPASSPARQRVGRWPLLIGETVVAIVVAAVCVVLARTIVVNPMERAGQVSGLAALGLHHVLLGLLAVALVGAVSRYASPAAARAAAACGCAAMAGLVTGFVSGGLAVALRGTVWPLYADQGDSGRIVGWANAVLTGGAAPADYPPGVIWAMTSWIRITGSGSEHAYQLFQIVGAALFGPLAYVAWRSLLRPAWALVMTLVAAVPLIDVYKPYANLVLVVLIPVLAHLLLAVRSASGRSWRSLAGTGAGAGVVLGALFVTYSGWFVWSAPGVLVLTLALFPWRTGAARALVLIGTASAVFLLIGARHLVGLARAAGGTPDSYQYFDTFTEPAYIAMWRSDLPGQAKALWPPFGELGGVGLFSLVLVVGLGAAIALGRHRADVLLLASCLTGAWLVRFYLASRMFATGSVQLYPRTTMEIFYCLLALCVLAAMLAVGRGHVLYRQWRAASGGGSVPSPRRPSAVVALLAACLLTGLFMGSATADRYMPLNTASAGFLTYVSQHVRQPDGTCPMYATPGECYPNGEVANTDLKTKW